MSDELRPRPDRSYELTRSSGLLGKLDVALWLLAEREQWLAEDEHTIYLLEELVGDNGRRADEDHDVMRWLLAEARYQKVIAYDGGFEHGQRAQYSDAFERGWDQGYQDGLNDQHK